MLTDPKTSAISIIIPTLNAADRIESTLASVITDPGVEVLLVDGGSTDQTVDIAKSYGVSILCSTPGRARQMNVGAAAASGDIFIFLHGDTVLPDGFADMVRKTLVAPEVSAGAFRLSFSPANRAMALIAWGANLRSSLLQMPYGDQAIFVRKETFTDMGGFPEMMFLEDLELVRRLKRLGRVVTRPEAIITSPLRWQQHGILGNTMRNQFILIGFFLGVDVERLSNWFRVDKNS